MPARKFSRFPVNVRVIVASDRVRDLVQQLLRLVLAGICARFEPAGPTMKLLLAVDGSSFSIHAIQSVLDMFSPGQTDVRVVHAVEWPKAAPISYAFAEGPEATRGIMILREEMNRAGAALVEEAAERLRTKSFRVTTELREGDARHVILDAAADWHPDLIAIGSHGRHGFDRFMLGSVSEGVVRHASCSVLVVRAKPSS